MADAKHPYIPSKGILVQLINQLRDSFPAKVDASVLKKLGIGSNNESVLVSTIRFLGLIAGDSFDFRADGVPVDRDIVEGVFERVDDTSSPGAI